MLKSLYEHEKDNKNIYDDIRKYCMAEQVNEAHFRASIKKPGLEYKPVNKRIIIALLVLGIIGSVTICSQNESFMTTENTNVQMIEGIGEDFIKSRENYKNFYYDFIIGNGRQVKNRSGVFCSWEIGAVCI